VERQFDLILGERTRVAVGTSPQYLVQRPPWPIGKIARVYSGSCRPRCCPVGRWHQQRNLLSVAFKHAWPAQASNLRHEPRNRWQRININMACICRHRLVLPRQQ